MANILSLIRAKLQISVQQTPGTKLVCEKQNGEDIFYLEHYQCFSLEDNKTTNLSKYQSQSNPNGKDHGQTS